MTQAFSVFAGSAKVYVWRNEQGVLDSPKPGAEEVDIKEPNTIKSSVDTSILDIKPNSSGKNCLGGSVCQS
jgi:hypothetical protein